MTDNPVTPDFFYTGYGAFIYGVHFTALYAYNMVVVMSFFRITQTVMLFSVKQLNAGKDAAFHHAFKVAIYAGKSALPEFIPELVTDIFRCHMTVIVNKQLYYGLSQGS